MPHPKLNTDHCRLNVVQKEFLNRIGGGNKRIGKHTAGLDKVLSRYFKLAANYECRFTEEQLRVLGSNEEALKRLPERDQLMVQVLCDRMMYLELMEVVQ